MNYFHIYRWIGGLLLVMGLFINACHGRWENNDADNTITIAGRVFDQSLQQPLDSASVSITKPPQFGQSASTDSTGAFRFEIISPKQVSLSIKTSKNTYKSQSRTLSVNPGSDNKNVNFRLIHTSKNSPDSGRTDGKGAAAISLKSSPPDAINIAETGHLTSTPFTFQVIDSAGHALTLVDSVEVQFKLLGSPGGKEHLIPEKTTTDEQGSVTTTLYSGNKAGLVKLQATLKASEIGFAMKSSPVVVAINGGFPESNHFGISSSQKNIEVDAGMLPTISVSLGDRFSNPVAPGTPISFKTSGGVIQGSAKTDKDGNASVAFTSLHPLPQNGKAIVTASTVNEKDETIFEKMPIIFSTSAAKIKASPISFKLKTGESQKISYHLTDLNGHPLTSNTKISVHASDSTKLAGDTDVILGDYVSGGHGKTDFSFTIYDTSDSMKKDIRPTITVSTPTGKTSNYRAITGHRFIEARDKVGAAAIALTNVPETAININETGEDVSAPLTFQVRDSLGRPLTVSNKVKVQFTLLNHPQGGEDLVPHQATTDSKGEVTTHLFSGNKAGPVKVQAKIVRSDINLKIVSKPVLIAIHGGFPDFNHFSIAPDNHNIEGLGINNLANQITVVLGDKFSNPVKPGTVVYFSTSGGIIQGSATTDANGITHTNLISGDPRPLNGIVTVTAATVNDNDERITKKTQVIFSSSEATITAEPTSFIITNNEGVKFSYTVKDINGNPMPAGTKISVDAGDILDLTGDVDFTLGDHLKSGPGSTKFNFSANVKKDNPNPNADITIRISVTPPSGNTTTFSGIHGNLN